MSVTWQGEQNCYSLPTLNKPIILVLLRDCRLWEIVEDRSDSWSWSNPYSPPPSWDPLKTIPFQQWVSQVLLCPHHQTAVLRSEAVLRCPLDIKHHEIKCGNEADYEDVWNAVPTCNISTQQCIRARKYVYFLTVLMSGRENGSNLISNQTSRILPFFFFLTSLSCLNIAGYKKELISNHKSQNKHTVHNPK